MDFDSIIFDLDGTLWDTCESCAIGWNRALDRLQIDFRAIVADDVRSVAGKPHMECITTVFKDLSPEQHEQLNKETSIEDNLMVKKHGGHLFHYVKPGIQELAEYFRLFIVSNCQQGYIETFLSWSGLEECFSDFESWGNTGRPKEENTASLIERNKLQHSLLVGDTEGDCAAAKSNGIPFAYVSYGFGYVESPDYSFDSFEEFTKWAL